MLPSTISPGDHEQIIALYQQAIADEPLARVEVDWYRGIYERQQDFLERIRTSTGSSGVLLVVKVRAEGVDANDVLATRLVRAFEHVVIAAAHPLANERLSNLAALTHEVKLTVRGAYEALASSMSLDLAKWGVLRPILELLLNPVDVVEAANALIEIQLEPAAPAHLDKALMTRAIKRLLASRRSDELVVLAAHATGKLAEGKQTLGEPRWSTAADRLETDMLVRDTKLLGWASWVDGDECRNVLREALTAAGRAPSDVASKVEAWLERPSPAERGPVWYKAAAAIALVAEGKLARAKEELEALERELLEGHATEADRGMYWFALGRYHLAVQRPAEAELALEKAIAPLRRVEKDSTLPGIALHDWAVALRALSRWPEAEQAFREALRLKKEGGDSPESLAFTLRSFAVGLRDNGRDGEADAALREAERLDDKGGT